jgi:hypothetical protein
VVSSFLFLPREGRVVAGVAGVRPDYLSGIGVGNAGRGGLTCA